jgi:multidrug efflux pump subunit AcrB
MWLIRLALGRPITIVVAILSVALCSVLAIQRMPVDIFPNLNLPVIYVAQPYGGMSPAQMEGHLTYYYEYHFLYISGIESVESKSIQNVGLLKLTFHPGTDMSQALAQTISYVNRARAFMPPGTVSPFVVRFDTGSVPVGYLVFSSPTRSLGEIQDLALNRVRPQFATLPGVSAPPPFGGNQRTIVISVNPDRLRAYSMSPQEVIRALSAGNVITPAGTVNAGDLTRLAPVNSIVSNIQDLLDLPIRTGAGPTVSIKDVGTVSDSTDLLAGYALVNSRRAVYIPVTKRADASTLTVVNTVKANLAKFQTLVPDDIKISYELDQSSYVTNALGALVREGLLGALLTGLVVLLFLRDWRSSAIVVVTIPFALVAAVVALWAAGQTINIMTLGGLALAVGILVDEATVTIENIHSHLRTTASRARAVLDATREVIVPLLLAMLSVLAVFVPSFFMTGVSQALFVPLSLAVGFAMAASFLLSSTLVPVLAIWTLRSHAPSSGDAEVGGRFHRFQDRYARMLQGLLPFRWVLIGAYLAVATACLLILGPRLGLEIFPQVSAGQFQLRLRAPAGTRVDLTEALAIKVLDQVKQTAGPENVDITIGYVGTQPSAYPIDTIYLWTSGPQEAVLQIALKPNAPIRVPDLEERLRVTLANSYPDVRFSFEAGDIVSRIMNFGAPTPVQVAIAGPSLAVNRAHAEKVLAEMGKIRSLRDLQMEQPIDYPSIDVNVNRQLAGQLGVTVGQVGQSLVTGTSSSRFVEPNYWRDPNTGVAYQVQVQIPQPRMTTIEDVQNIPVMAGQALHPLVGDVARVTYGTAVGEYDRYNGQRMLTLAANVSGEDLGRTATEIGAALKRAGDPPKGVTVSVRGQIAPMWETLRNLSIGLAMAVLVIFLVLAANFQSLKLGLVVLSTVPAVLCGVIIALAVTGTTVNIQSFMGAIMAIGVAVANAILLVTFAEQYRRAGETGSEAAVHGARSRLRPILMTSLAMIAGMMPMALAIGAGAEEAAPLGRAVVGGLAAATIATVGILPLMFTAIQGRASTRSASLDPDDPDSPYADAPANRPVRANGDQA